MKKTIFALLIGAILCCMTSCGGNEADVSADLANTPETSAETVGNVSEEAADGYTVVLDNGTTFVMGAPADDTVAALGEPQSMTEAPSCVHEGMDRLYDYGGYTLTTSPDANGKARIQEISLASDAVALADGLTIGSDKAAVEAAFGTDYTDSFGVLTFSLEGASVSVVLDADECVSALTITAK